MSAFAEEAIAAAQQAVLSGEIVAVKGIGGFQLACDAANDEALRRLRERKGRVDKPFAVMARDPETAAQFAFISEAERALLVGRERPIVRLKKKPGGVTALSHCDFQPGEIWRGIWLVWPRPWPHIMEQTGRPDELTDAGAALRRAKQWQECCNSLKDCLLKSVRVAGCWRC
jgi:hydrogenase maturation protein HypF